jgi:hypothetical protein
MEMEQLNLLHSQLERTSQEARSALDIVKALQPEELARLRSQDLDQLQRRCAQLEEDVTAIRNRIGSLPTHGRGLPTDDE